MNHGPAVLLADDNEPFITSAAKYLTKRGYQCDVEPDGIRAARKLAEKRYDVLVADIMMTGNERLELIEETRKLEEQLPVILVTGHPTVETAVQAIGMPVVAYMLKPFRLSDLLRNVELAIARGRLVGKIASCRKRFDDIEDSLMGLEHTVMGMPIDQTRLPVEMFVDLTTRTLLDCIGDITTLIRSASSGEDTHVCRLYHCPRLDLLKGCLKESVDVIERTKGSFRSKELAGLRKTIEDVLSKV